MPQLSRGQKMKLADLTTAQVLRVALATAPGVRFDFCCFGLDENARLSDDRYFVFYNQKAAPQNAICISGERAGEAATFAVALAKLPASVSRLIFAMIVDGQGTMADLSGGQWSILAEGHEIARFNFAGRDFGSEKSLIVGEVYLHGGQWRLAAVGQGFREGLSALLNHYGGQGNSAPNAPRATPPAPKPLPLRPVPSPLNPPSARPIPAPAPRATVNASNAPVCARCGKAEGLLGRIGIGALNPTTRQCRECEVKVKAAFEQLRVDFGRDSHSGVMNTQEWGALWQRFEAARTGATRAQAMELLRPDALRFMEQLVTMAASDGVITAQEESYVRQMCAFLEVPLSLQTPFLARLEEVKQTARIREGHLPRVAAGDFHLDSDELCHLNVAVTYHKVGARSTTQIAGRLLATSKKLIFVSSSGGRAMQFKNVMTVRTSGSALILELSTQSGNGRYSVQNAEHCEAVVTALTRMAKRQLLSPQSDKPSRHIPQHIQREVWQRDGGNCVQCRATTYLEFDHIIPHSKGGASTLNNVQLLCRKCNGEKGDRI